MEVPRHSTLQDLAQMEMPTKIKDRLRYLDMLMRLTEQAIRDYRKIQRLPDHVADPARKFLLILKDYRCLWRQNTNIKNPLVGSSNLTESALIWYATAQLGDLIFGLTAHDHGFDTDMFKSLQKTDQETRLHLQNSHLVMYDVPVLDYSMSQLEQTYMLLRSRWREFSLVDCPHGVHVMALRDLLDLRAGFLATHEGCAAIYDVHHYVTRNMAFMPAADASNHEKAAFERRQESENQYSANENFFTNMEVYDFMLRRETVVMGHYPHPDSVWEVDKTIKGDLTLKPSERRQKLLEAGPVPDFFDKVNGSAWSSFESEIMKITELSKGRRDNSFFYKSIILRYLLPIGEKEAWEARTRSPVQYNKLVNIMRPSSGITRIYDSIMTYDANFAIEECLVRAKMMHHISCKEETQQVWSGIFRRDPLQEAFFVYVFDKMLGMTGLEWAKLFYYTEEEFCAKRSLINNLIYPKVVSMCNSWFVVHQNHTWHVAEPVLACFLWLYIIKYSYHGQITIANQSIDLTDTVNTVMTPPPALQGIGLPQVRQDNNDELHADSGMHGDAYSREDVIYM